MSNICLSVPRESSYNLPIIPMAHLDSEGVYIGSNPTPHLWPPGPRDKASSAARSVQAGFGVGADRGALRRLPNGRWLMTEFGGEVLWKPHNRDHYLAASAFNRYGVGWSFGPAHNQHDEAYGKWEELCGSPPEQIQKWDIDYSLQLWRQLDSEWRAKFGQAIEPQEPQEPTKPVEPINPIEPVKPVEPTPSKPVEAIEPKPQEPSMPSVNPPIIENIYNEIKATRIDLAGIRKDLLRDVDAEVDGYVMIERQWWHDNLQPIIDDFRTKRPALAERLSKVLSERKIE